MKTVIEKPDKKNKIKNIFNNYFTFETLLDKYVLKSYFI